jgi:hypothetical protein
MEVQGQVLNRMKWSTAACALMIGAAFTQQANAGCLDMSGFMKKTRFDSDTATAQGGFIKAGYERDEEWASGFFHAPIVGLWSFKYVAEGNGSNGPPDGTAVDGGNTLWFADGNEITYSAIRNPTTGATCLGIWKQTGRHTYELNHIGVSWDSTFTGPFGGSSGPAFIRQSIKLAPDEMSYTGTFEINQLEADGKTRMPGFPIKGKIKASRVTMDTTTQTLPQSGNEKQ